MASDWITTDNAAELSGYDRHYLRALIRNGDVKGQKFGTIWQVSKQSLLAYMKTAKESEDKRWGPKNP